MGLVNTDEFAIHSAGPVRCVNHIIFIESKNIEILGGEVEAMAIDNAFENVLLRALNKPPNPEPKTNYEGKSQKQLLQNIPSFVCVTSSALYHRLEMKNPFSKPITLTQPF